ncbi:OppA family ABC transporter substrate-binding lipoprotein [[Mycoplasma] collis]|uniref:OppA family ABC transporter substrate-binding lipoprotein n=1 Tax=[Mycoplasma] collis TaxID=2127 RepID=UPI00051B8A96|nr:hypothetical protein [[Mycoplasma] collis]
MKKKNKKNLFLFLTTIATLTPLSIVSCSRLIEPELNRNELSFYINAATTNINKFSLDYGIRLATNTSQDSYLLSPTSFLVKAFENETVYQTGNVQKTNNNEYTEPEYTVKSATHTFYRFAASEKIIVTANDDTKYIFDNDDHEIIPENVNNLPTLTLKSNNKKSINSDFFIEKLANAKKLQFVIKKDIPWMHYDGKKSKYNIKPLDFYYGWMRTLLSESKYRRANGGTKEIDDKIIASGNLGTQNIFNDDSALHNIYLLDIFGIDKESIRKQDKYLTSYDDSDDKAVTFYADGKAIFNDFIDKLVIDSTFFAPAPSAFIEEKNEQENKEINSTGLAKKYGIYWYANDFEKNLLYSSRYLPSYTSFNRREFTRNKYYSENGWGDPERESKSIKKIIEKYNSYPDATQFSNAMFNNYLEDSKSILSSSEYNTLSLTDKGIINNNANEIRYISTKDKNQLKRTYTFLYSPGPMNYLTDAKNFDGGTVAKKWYFNENYAKLIYNSSLKDLQEGKLIVSSNALNNHSLGFRTILDAAFNSYAHAKNKNPSLEPWISFAPPDNKIGGKDEVTNDKKTFRDYNDELNKTVAINHKGEIFYTKTLEQEKEHYLKNINNSENQYLAPRFNELQKAMKELLDDFYAKNNLANTEKIEFYINNRFRNENAASINAIEQIAKVYEKLDSRIKINLISQFTGQDFFNILVKNYGTVKFSGWNADYDGAGTFLDGLQYYGSLLTISSNLAQQKEDSQLAKNFPEFYKYSKKLKAHFDELKAKSANKAYLFTDFDNWKNARNLSDYEIRSLSYYEAEKKDDNETFGSIKLLDQNGKLVDKLENKQLFFSKEFEISKETNKKTFIDYKPHGTNEPKDFITKPTFEINGKLYFDETYEKTFQINGKSVKKVYSHKRNKWVDPKEEVDISGLVSIFNLKYQK